jgi:hypothetical protein
MPMPMIPRTATCSMSTRSMISTRAEGRNTIQS